MAVAHKTVISFGLVAIPISLYTATQDNDIRFNQLHKEDSSRIRYKKTCAHCGKEIGPGDIVKGYQYDAEKYVVVTDEELEKIKTEKEKSIQILHFANLNQISPVYMTKPIRRFRRPEVKRPSSCCVPPHGGTEDRDREDRSGTRDTLMAIIPREEGVLISTMFYEDEIKALQKQHQKPELKEQELKMAKALIETMDTPFDPSQYKDEYQVKLKELLENKVAGKEVVSPKSERPDNVIDLMDALKASIEQNKKRKQESKGSKGA
jgi:DNA end-binding protein Ku